MAAAPASAAVRVDGERLLPAWLLLGGLLFPTAVAGGISIGLILAHEVLFCVLAIWIGITRRAFGSIAQVWNAAFIVAWLLAMSVVSPFRELAAGAAAVYIGMALLLSLDVGRLQAADPGPLLIGFTLLLFLAGILVVVGNPAIGQVLSGSYAMAYPELVPNMLMFRKPVFTFGSHSIAGYFYFLLFYLHLESWRVRGQVRYLVLAIACVTLGLFLTSVTAGVLMAWALGLLFLHAGRFRWLLAGIAVVAAATAAYLLRDSLAELAVVTDMLRAFESQGGGLRGRYTEGGSLLTNLEVIRSNPLRPIGLTFSSELFFGDSGPVEYVLRGSLPLLLAVYGGLATFLWRGLRQRRHVLILLGATLAFEIGFTVLTYHRFMYFFVFVVLYLNQLSTPDAGPRSASGLEPRHGERPA